MSLEPRLLSLGTVEVLGLTGIGASWLLTTPRPTIIHHWGLSEPDEANSVGTYWDSLVSPFVDATNPDVPMDRCVCEPETG